MNNLKNYSNLTFALLFLVALVASVVMLQLKYHETQALNEEERIAYIEVESTVDYFATNEAFYFIDEELIQNPGVSSQNASIGFNFPFFGSPNKIQLILTQLIFAFICLLIATKFQIETSIYEFFHKDENGMVWFDNSSSEITHNLTIYTGIIFKVVGISCGFLSLFVFVF